MDDIDLPHAYRLRLPSEVISHELTHIQRDATGAITGYNKPTADLYELSEIHDLFHLAASIPYEQEANEGVEKRPIEHIRTRYLGDDLSPLPFGSYHPIGLPYEGYQLAFTPSLFSSLYSREDGSTLQVEGINAVDLLESEGRYVAMDGSFWIRSGRVHFRESAGEILERVRARFFSPLAFEDPLGTQTSVVYDTETFSGISRNNDGYYLYIKSIKDALGNTTRVDVFNYRTMTPSRTIDANANPTSVLYNELGLVKASAIEGNGIFENPEMTSIRLLQAADALTGLREYEEPWERLAVNVFLSAATYQSTNTNELRVRAQELLQQSSVRFVYDFEVYKRITDANETFLEAEEYDNIVPLKPNVVAALMREEHAADNPESNLQIGFEYSDGAGNVAMTKVQAEPGLAYYVEDGERRQKDTVTDLRWIGSGRTILNNKGNPVKQYEPYFSTHFLYEDDPQLVEIGVTPVLHYDALGRLTKAELPDGTLTHVLFDSWSQQHYDQNDTVLESEMVPQKNGFY